MGEDDLKVKENGNNTSPTNSDGEGLIIAPIEVIIPGVYSDDESEKEDDIKKKKRKKNKVDKTMVLTKTFGQALRLINEQKIREKQKAKQEEIRNMALEQKARREQAGRAGAPVIIHI